MIDINMQAPDQRMSFSIDAARTLLDWAMDQRPGASEDMVNDILATEICGQMRSKATGQGVANVFWKYGALISRMREQSPGQHDQCVLEFAELLTARPWDRRKESAIG